MKNWISSRRYDYSQTLSLFTNEQSLYSRENTIQSTTTSFVPNTSAKACGWYRSIPGIGTPRAAAYKWWPTDHRSEYSKLQITLINCSIKQVWSFCLNWQMHLHNVLEKTQFNSPTLDLLRVQPWEQGNTVPDPDNDLPSSFHWLLHPEPREALWHVNLPSFNFHTPYTPYIHSCALATAQAHRQWLQGPTGGWPQRSDRLYKLVHSHPSSILWVARHLMLIYKGETLRTPLGVQRLRIQLPVQGMGLIPDEGTKIPHDVEQQSPRATVREVVHRNGRSHVMQRRSCMQQLRLKAAN